MKKIKIIYAGVLTVGILLATGCGDDDQTPQLVIPDEYISPNYEANVTAESAVIRELATITSAANAAESKAQSGTITESITYPQTLQNVTLPSYRTLVEGWLVELVAAANDDSGFRNPGAGGTPAAGEQGGLLGTRLLDENGLELEQVVQKGSFGATLYNHALSVINAGNLTSDDIDKLIEIHGADIKFDPDSTTAAATYSGRRSNQTTQKGAFYDIRTALITAKAAAAGGFTTRLNAALGDYLLAWEKSNFATVIYYCHATGNQLRTTGSDEEAQGNAMHAYAEGVGFVHGFRGISTKKITDAQIDRILTLLLAPAGQTPESFKYLNDATLLDNLETVITEIKGIYGFTDDEIQSFYINDPT